MLWLFIAFVLFSVSFVLLGFGKVKSKDGYNENLVWKLKSKQLFSLFGLLIILTGTYKFVPVNSVGIKFNQFSGLSDQIMAEGLKFKSPLDEVYLISTEVRTKSIIGIAGQTRDAQWIKINLDVKYRVSEENAYN